MKELKFHGEKVIIGQNSLDYLRSINGKRVFVVAGKESVFKNGTMDLIKANLKDGNNDIKIFSGIDANPDKEIVLDGVNHMKSFSPNVIIAVGGGSAIDAAKVMSVFYEYENINFNNFKEFGIPRKREKTYFIAIPTTSGTGTEVTKAAVITFKEENIKIGMKSEAFIPDLAILDPLVTLSMPKKIIAESGIDAMTHAIEAYMNHKLDDITEIMVIGSIEGLMKYLPLSYGSDNLIYREKVHNYQCLAGMAFHNVGLGMSHGISHGFGGKYNLSHGLLNGIALPYVMEFNKNNQAVKEKLLYLSEKLAVKSIVEEIRKLNVKIGIPLSLSEGVLEEEDFLRDFDELVSLSLQGSTVRNPVKMDKDSMGMLLKDIFYGK